METIINKQENQVSETRREAGLYSRKPHYSVSENEAGYVVRVELPGVQKSDLDLSVENRVLSIEARREENLPEDWKAIRRSLPAHRFELRLSLNQEVDSGKIEARLENGILSLNLPKVEAARARKITVS